MIKTRTRGVPTVRCRSTQHIRNGGHIGILLHRRRGSGAVVHSSAAMGFPGPVVTARSCPELSRGPLIRCTPYAHPCSSPPSATPARARRRRRQRRPDRRRLPRSMARRAGPRERRARPARAPRPRADGGRLDTGVEDHRGGPADARAAARAARASAASSAADGTRADARPARLQSAVELALQHFSEPSVMRPPAGVPRRSP